MILWNIPPQKLPRPPWDPVSRSCFTCLSRGFGGSCIPRSLGSIPVWQVFSCLDCRGTNYKKGWPGPEIYKMDQLDQQDSTCYMHLKLSTRITLVKIYLCQQPLSQETWFLLISMDFWGKKWSKKGGPFLRSEKLILEWKCAIEIEPFWTAVEIHFFLFF